MRTYAVFGKHKMMVMAIRVFFDNLQPGDGLNCIFDACCKNELDGKLDQFDVKPDVLLVDIGVDFVDAISELREVASSYPCLKIIAISDFTHEEAIEKILNAGASSILGKQMDPDAFYRLATEAINSIGVRQPGSRKTASERFNLSHREISFLQYCATELTYKEIADRMYVSASTVNNYREALFLKLGIKNRVGLVLFGINSLLINPFRTDRKVSA